MYQPPAQLGRLDEELECLGDVATGRCDQPEPAHRDAFPAGVADLTPQSKRMLEPPFRGVDVAEAQIDLRPKRLRPRPESGEASVLDSSQDVIEHASCGLDLSA